MSTAKKYAAIDTSENIGKYFKEAANKEIYWKGDILFDGDRFSFNFSTSLSGLSLELRYKFKDLFIEFINLNQYSKMSYWTMAGKLNASLRNSKPSLLDVTWLSKALESKSFSVGASIVLKLLKFIQPRCPSLLDSAVLNILSNTRAGLYSRRNVLSDDPEKSKFTNGEFDLIVWSIWDKFDKGLSGTQATLLRLFACHYFRRPAQFSQLKIGDIHLNNDDDISGIRAPRVFFPGAKDKGAASSFRSTKFEFFPLPDHFIELIQLQIYEIKVMFETFFNFKITIEDLNKLPLFCSNDQIKYAVKSLKDRYKLAPLGHLEHQSFHLAANLIGTIIAWRSNSAMTARIGNVAMPPPISHRTNVEIVINATRHRHTGIFRLARRGVSKSYLTYVMGHKDPRSLDAYYKDPAEEARVLDEAMKDVLVEVQMAFTGKLLGANEKLNVIKNNPDSILEHSSGYQLNPVGSCGKHSFCSTQTIPIPCYRCNNFQPFVDANHQEVLDALLIRQKQENEIIHLGSSKNLLNPVDLSSDIECVLSVISQCKEYIESERGGEDSENY